MFEQNDDRAARVAAEADQLVAEIRSQLDASADFYRQQGLDRQNPLGPMRPELQQEADRILAADLAADLAEVEREVAEGKPLPTTRPPFYAPPPSSRPAKRRMMI